MSNLPYYLIVLVFVLLVIGIGAVERKYDNQLRDIHDELDKLKNDIEESEGRYWDLEDRIHNLESETSSSIDENETDYRL